METLPVAGGLVAAAGPQGRVMPVDELALPGRHNVSNVLAAVAVGLLFGIAPDGIRRAVAGFTGVEHRLELVAVVDGVRFVNDSQGTQPDAVIAGLRELRAAARADRRRPRQGRRTCAELARVAVDRARRGRPDRRERARSWRALLASRPATPTSRAPRTWRPRSTEADRHAPAGWPEGRLATVLLSPAAASFDMFVDYAARGRAFKAAVAAIARDRSA